LGIFVITILLLEFAPYAYYPLIYQRNFDRSEIRGRLLEDVQSERDSNSTEGIRKKRADPDFTTYQILHPFFGFVGNPEMNSRISDFGMYYNLATDTTDTVFRVCIAGGSVADGVFTHSWFELRGKIAERFHVHPHKIAMHCMAQAGFKQPQQLIALSYLLSLGAIFDVVINIDGYNELVLTKEENAATGVYPFFPRSWNFYAAKGNDAIAIARAAEL